MPRKNNKPRTKHKRFPTFHVRLSENDWLIGMFNPNNKQAMYFLAEPSTATDDKKKIVGYLVTALERAGESSCSLKGLPRKFRTTEDAEEWLDNQMEDYPGDEFTAAAEYQGLEDVLFDEDTKTGSALEQGIALHADLEKQIKALK